MQRRTTRPPEDELAPPAPPFANPPLVQPTAGQAADPAVPSTDFSLDGLQFDAVEASVAPPLPVVSALTGPLTLQRQEDEQAADATATQPAQPVSREEQRLADHRTDLAGLLDVAELQAVVTALGTALASASTLAQATELARTHGRQLWAAATARAQGRAASPAAATATPERPTEAPDQPAADAVATPPSDDRPLYWSRLEAIGLLRNWAGATLEAGELDTLIDTFERSSRGMESINFAEGAAKKILVSGFDPFGLDSNLYTSNPSGAMALAFDGQIIGGAQVESVVFPVRYEDFDAGIVESVFEPWLDSVDMIVTISQGRSTFEAERYTGRRRSVDQGFLDNAGVSGGSETAPVIPPGLEDAPEFQESNIPFDFDAHGRAVVNGVSLYDHRVVRYIPQGSAEPTGETAAPPAAERAAVGDMDDGTLRAVEGSGGGFLSNEISYRANYVRNQRGATIPVWHLHTPRLDRSGAGADGQRQTLIEQARTILAGAVANLGG